VQHLEKETVGKQIFLAIDSANATAFSPRKFLLSANNGFQNCLANKLLLNLKKTIIKCY